MSVVDQVAFARRHLLYMSSIPVMYVSTQHSPTALRYVLLTLCTGFQLGLMSKEVFGSKHEVTVQRYGNYDNKKVRVALYSSCIVPILCICQF